jgi:hypothetical protein
MEAIFEGIPKNGKMSFFNQEDFFRYCIENDGVHSVITIKPKVKTSEKLRMYAYLFGPLLEAAVKGYTNAGWEFVDKHRALHLFKMEFAKSVQINPITGEEVTFLEDLSGMNKKRLLKFIQDCILYLEMELGEDAPDSSLWKMYQETGKGFRSVKFDKG